MNEKRYETPVMPIKKFDSDNGQVYLYVNGATLGVSMEGWLTFPKGVKNVRIKFEFDLDAAEMD